MSGNAMLGSRQAGQRLGLSEAQVRVLIRDGRLRAVNVGTTGRHARWRIDPADLAAFEAGRANIPRSVA